MRKILLATVCITALFGGTAHAQWLTFDSSQFANALNQLKQGAQQLREAQQTTQTVTSTYQALSHVTDLGSAVSALGMVGIQDPLPVSPYALEGLMRGTGGASGMAGNLGNLFNSNLSSNSIFQSRYPSDGSTYMNERLNSVSAGQGIADTMFQSAQTRMPLVRQLVNRLNTAQDPADKLDLIARLSGEQNIASLQTNQAVATMMMSQQAEKAAQLRAEQRTLKSNQAWLDQARSETGTW